MFYLLKTGEIILKGKNRVFFERVLVRNIKKKLGDNLVYLKNYGGIWLLKAKKEANEDIKKIFGIENFSPTIVKDSLQKIKEEILKIISKGLSFDFNLEVSRGDKDYYLNSIQIKQKLKEDLEKENLKFNPQAKNNFYVYYRDKKFFLYRENIKCFGGLPVSSSGKVLSLISAGFDSPVASFLMMKRGLKIYFLHFHSYPQTSMESIEKVKNLVKILNEYNLGSELYLMNILELQKFYYLNIPKEYLVIFYRRSMFRLGERLLKEIKLDALITGENLGQVASQTVENLKVIESSISSLVLRPILGFNKQEIIDLAKKIGTEEVSKKPGDDCCSLFVPTKVKTKARLEKVLDIEEKIKDRVFALEEKIYKDKELLNFIV